MNGPANDRAWTISVCRGWFGRATLEIRDGYNIKIAETDSLATAALIQRIPSLQRRVVKWYRLATILGHTVERLRKDAGSDPDKDRRIQELTRLNEALNAEMESMRRNDPPVGGSDPMAAELTGRLRVATHELKETRSLLEKAAVYRGQLEKEIRGHEAEQTKRNEYIESLERDLEDSRKEIRDLKDAAGTNGQPSSVVIDFSTDRTLFDVWKKTVKDTLISWNVAAEYVDAAFNAASTHVVAIKHGGADTRGER